MFGQREFGSSGRLFSTGTSSHIPTSPSCTSHGLPSWQGFTSSDTEGHVGHLHRPLQYGPLPICANGQRLVRRRLFFHKWEKRLFVVDFLNQEIRCYKGDKTTASFPSKDEIATNTIAFGTTDKQLRPRLRKYAWEKYGNLVLNIDNGKGKGQERLIVPIDEKLAMEGLQYRLEQAANDKSLE